MNKPANKNRQSLAIHKQPANIITLNDERACNLTNTKNVSCFQEINGSNNISILGGNNVNINSDNVITGLIDVITQQASTISRLTDNVISLTDEIITLRLKLKSLEL